MEHIKEFIITLVTTIIFITAVEIIAPDKPIKKYIKFVLNLILVSVLINPIVYIFTRGEEEIINSISSYEEMFSDGAIAESSNVVTEERIDAFRENLNNNCNSMLEEKFGDKTFNCDVECILDLENMTYNIEKVRVGVKDSKIKVIEKIIIDTNSSTEAMSSEHEVEDREEIVDYLTEKLNIGSDKIEVYKMEGSE